jgi:hypothetical protein
VEKNSVYNGEVIGFKVCRLFKSKIQIVGIEFSTYEEAEKYAESTNELTTNSAVYFPVKLTSMKNASIEAETYA